jgi:hypothetical protein
MALRAIRQVEALATTTALEDLTLGAALGCDRLLDRYVMDGYICELDPDVQVVYEGDADGADEGPILHWTCTVPRCNNYNCNSLDSSDDDAPPAAT